MDRVKAQEQLVVVMTTLAGVAASFGGQFRDLPELPAAAGLAFMFFALVVLRQDQEITVIADYLRHRSVFGAHADAQAGWERHKFKTMQKGGWARNPLTVAQVIALYGVPLLAGIGFSAAAAVLAPTNWRVLTAVSVTTSLFLLFLLGATEVVRRYQELGHVVEQ